MRTIVSICVYVLTVAVAASQGTVWFRNRGYGAPFFDDHGMWLEGPSYVAQLYFWRLGEGFRAAAGSPVPFATNGYFYGVSVRLPFVPECAPAWVQVRAWETQAGATFEEAALAGAWTGLSGVLFLPRTGSPSRPEDCGSARLFGLQYPGEPIIVRQPQSQTVNPGTIATLSVIASSGVQMLYQWHQDPNDRPDGLIPGATNSAYTTPALHTNTTFWVSITNTAGSTLSERATVAVVPRAPQLRLDLIAGLPALTIDGVVGSTYRIEYNTNLNTSNWIVLAELSLTSNPFTFVDTQGTNSAMCFYRVVIPP